MYLEVLRRTVGALIESVAPKAQYRRDVRLDNKGFAKLLQVVKGCYSQNRVIRDMNPGEWKKEISAVLLFEKLSIIKAQLEEM